MDYFSGLPREILSLILLHPDLQLYLLILTFICKRWHRIVQPHITLLNKKTLSKQASKGGQLSILKWIRSQKFPLYKFVIREGLIRQDVDMVEWACQAQLYWDVGTFLRVIDNKNLTLAKLLISYGCPLNNYTCIYAIQKGNIPILKVLRGTKLPLTIEMYRTAVEKGQLEVLEWFRNLKDKWGWNWEWLKDICEMATSAGHLDILRWARLQGFPWNKRTCRIAVRNRCTSIIKWLSTQDCPCEGEYHE